MCSVIDVAGRQSQNHYQPQTGMMRETGTPNYSFLTSLQNPFSSLLGLPNLASDLLDNLLTGDLESRKKHYQVFY